MEALRRNAFPVNGGPGSILPTKFGNEEVGGRSGKGSCRLAAALAPPIKTAESGRTPLHVEPRLRWGRSQCQRWLRCWLSGHASAERRSRVRRPGARCGTRESRSSTSSRSSNNHSGASGGIWISRVQISRLSLTHLSRFQGFPQRG